MSDALNHAELSRELASALGWPHAEAWGDEECALVKDYDMVGHWFDYRDPDVCLPLIKWLGSEYRMFFWYCSPTSLAGPRWSCSGRGIVAPALEEAVARAVIAVRKG